MSHQSEPKLSEDQLRQALSANRGRHFPAHLRKAAAAYWSEARSRGVSRNRISKALGISVTTLTRWSQPAEGESTSGTMRLVQVLDEPAGHSLLSTSTIVVHTSSGLRIEGLDINALADLIRACQ